MNFYFEEDKKLLSLIKKEKTTILDVGCGEGRYLIPLASSGHNVVGVDINVDEHIVRVWKKLLNKVFFVFYKISFGLISRTTGWIEFLKKLGK